MQVLEHIIGAPQLISLVISVSTPEQRMAMAPASSIDRAVTSLGMKPRLGPRKRTESFSILMVSIGVMLTQREILLKVARF